MSRINFFDEITPDVGSDSGSDQSGFQLEPIGGSTSTSSFQIEPIGGSSQKQEDPGLLSDLWSKVKDVSIPLVTPFGTFHPTGSDIANTASQFGHKVLSTIDAIPAIQNMKLPEGVTVDNNGKIVVTDPEKVRQNLEAFSHEVESKARDPLAWAEAGAVGLDPTGTALGVTSLGRSAVEDVRTGNVGGMLFDVGMGGLLAHGARSMASAEVPPRPVTPGQMELPFGRTEPYTPVEPTYTPPPPEPPAVQKARAFSQIDTELNQKVLEMKVMQSEATRNGDHATATAYENEILRAKMDAFAQKRDWVPPPPEPAPVFEDLGGAQQPDIPFDLYRNQGRFTKAENVSPEMRRGVDRPSPFTMPEPAPIEPTPPVTELPIEPPANVAPPPAVQGTGSAFEQAARASLEAQKNPETLSTLGFTKEDLAAARARGYKSIPGLRDANNVPLLLRSDIDPAAYVKAAASRGAIPEGAKTVPPDTAGEGGFIDIGDIQSALSGAKEKMRQFLADESGAADPEKIIRRIAQYMLPARHFEETMFLLPDGTKYTSDAATHGKAMKRIGTTADAASKAGVVRVSGLFGGAEAHGPITEAQSQVLADAPHYTSNPDITIDVHGPKGTLDYKTFDKGTSPNVIRQWVNAHFDPNIVKRLITDEEGSFTPGQAWKNLKEKTGIGGTPRPTPEPIEGVDPKQQARDAAKAGSTAVDEALGLAKSATTMLDYSAMKQTASQWYTKEFRQAIPKMIKAGWSAELDKAIHEEILSKDIFQRPEDPKTGKPQPSWADKVGFKLIEGGKDLGKRSEMIGSNWIENGRFFGVPDNPISRGYAQTWGRVARSSTRAFKTMINYVAANRLEYLADRARDMAIEGVTTGSVRQGVTGLFGVRTPVNFEQAMNLNPYNNLVLGREISDFVRTATGQAPLKVHLLPFREAEWNLEAHTKALTRALFAPRSLFQKFRMLNPSTYMMATPEVRLQYMKAALASTFGWLAITKMVQMAAPAFPGANVRVSWDPENADFGKIRVGNTRLDFGQGFLPFLVSAYRFASGHYVSSATGLRHQYGQGFQAQTQLGQIGRTVVGNKLEPFVAFATDLLSATEQQPFHVGDRALQMAIPMAAQDIYDILTNEPGMLPFATLPILAGAASQTYGKKARPRFIPGQNDWVIKHPAMGGGLF